MNYTITLSEAQNKAMTNIALDVDTWITNVVESRAQAAIDDICKIYTEHKLNNNEAITVIGKDAMVLAAFEEGIVTTVEAQNAAMDAADVTT